mmetsp:Transcript_38723/g.116960  ORF Transcript_38723/g.116960 Transcript_38723/m.116960 type:complete len:291 (+) Transcript_38723:149-1021(+)
MATRRTSAGWAGQRRMRRPPTAPPRTRRPCRRPTRPARCFRSSSCSTRRACSTSSGSRATSRPGSRTRRRGAASSPSSSPPTAGPCSARTTPTRRSTCAGSSCSATWSGCSRRSASCLRGAASSSRWPRPRGARRRACAGSSGCTGYCRSTARPGLPARSTSTAWTPPRRPTPSRTRWGSARCGTSAFRAAEAGSSGTPLCTRRWPRGRPSSSRFCTLRTRWSRPPPPRPRAARGRRRAPWRARCATTSSCRRAKRCSRPTRATRSPWRRGCWTRRRSAARTGRWRRCTC